MAIEQLALALGASAAVPRGELVRALERAAERLRTGSTESDAPVDLISQAEAARLVGVSRQAVNQWIRKGLVRSYPGDGALGRRGAQVSLAEISVAANRWRAEAFPSILRQQVGDFLDTLAGDRQTHALAEQIRDDLDSNATERRADDAARVLREFLVAAMSTAGSQMEFTSAGVRMLADLAPEITVDLSSPLGDLMDTLGLLVRSADGGAGFDSPSAALLGLLGAATIGAQPGGPDAGHRISQAAREVWQEDWVRRLFDVAYHVEETTTPSFTRYPAALVYLGCNRFMRQAQRDGVSVTYAALSGALLPQFYYGRTLLEDLLSGRPDTSTLWRPVPGPLMLQRQAQASDISPFRVFNFDYGLFDPTIYGIRRYCFSAERTRQQYRSFVESLPADRRAPYRDLAVRTLAGVLEKPFVEMTCVEAPASFDWWKDHMIRSSPRETLIGLRDDKARKVAHAILVRSSVLPEVIETGAEDGQLRERLRVYVRNLTFEIVDERYADDLSRGVTRLITSANDRLSPDEAMSRAEAEIAAIAGD